MKSRLKKSLVLAITMLAFILSACGGNNSTPATSSTPAAPSPSPTAPSPSPAAPANGETYVMKIGGQHADSSVHSRMITEIFIKRVGELSGGRIKCEFYGNNALGNEIDQLAQLQMNTLQMALISEQSANLDPAHMMIPCLPFLFESEAHWDEVMDGELGKELFAKLPALGVRILGVDENGYRVVTNNVRPINTAADMKGLKMRVSTNDLYIANFTALGCSCQAMTIGEAYTALETGACDGQDNAYNTIRSANLHEVQKYLANTNHVLGSMYLAVNEAWFQSLPADMQKAVQTATDETIQWERRTYRELAAKDLEFLIEAGLKVTDPDIKSFQDATVSVYENFFTKYPEAKDLVERIQALAD